MNKLIKKIIPFCLILLILVGLFSPMAKVEAETYDGIHGTCNLTYTSGATHVQQNVVSADCPPRTTGTRGEIISNYVFQLYSDANPNPDPTSKEKTVTVTTKDTRSAFEQELTESCGFFNIMGCVLTISYYTGFQLPAAFLWLSAQFFNSMVSLSINSSLTSSSSFVPEAWAVVRDLSNIFFILVLLYVALQTILGIGHDTKKVIVQVVIMALLINFSMFFTKVVIDTSNILALVFYNKLETTTPAVGSTPTNEKDISGKLYQKFNATNIMTIETIQKLKTTTVNGVATTEKTLPVSLSFGIIVFAGIIMFMAGYAFFVAGLSFLGRLIELWMLIIFSPFAFMSSTIPMLSHIPYLGWEAWVKRLIATAFMAPIFMFFMYLIFKLMSTNMFQGFSSGEGKIASFLGILIPALIVFALLRKATDFASKGGGELGDMVVKAGKAVGGLALGAATGGAGMALQGTLGRAGKAIYESKSLADSEAKGGRWAKTLRSIGGGADGKGGMAGSSFDARMGLIGGAMKAASVATGINMGGAGSKFMMRESGGYEADLKKRDAKRKERAEGLRVKEGENSKQHLNDVKEENQGLVLTNEEGVHKMDKDITSAEGKRTMYAAAAKANPKNQAMKDAAREAADEVVRLKGERSRIKNGMLASENGNYNTHNGQMSKQEAETIMKEAAKATNAGDVVLQAKSVIAKATLSATASKKAQEVAAANPANAMLADAAKTTAEAAKVALEEAKTASEAAGKIADQKATDTKEAATKAFQLAAADPTNIKLKEDSTKAAKEAKVASANAGIVKKAANASKGLGNSQNDYEDEIIPGAEHHIKHVNDRRTQDYAESIQNGGFFWSADERKKSAHEIRMGVKSQKDHDGGDHGSQHFFGDLAAGFLVHAATSDSDSGGGAPPPAGADHGKGGGNAH